MNSQFVPMALVAFVVLGTATDARAQVSLGTAVGASTQTGGKSDLPYLGPPFGGTSTAVLGMVDVAVASNVTVGGEASLATAIDGTQSQRAPGGANSFVSQHRDSVFNGTLKVGMPLNAPIRVAFVIGGGLAHRRTKRLGTFRSDRPPFAAAPFSATVSDVAATYTAGVDVTVRVARHLSALALARWHQLVDDDRTPDGVVKRGVSATVFRFGAGVQFRF